MQNKYTSEQMNMWTKSSARIGSLLVCLITFGCATQNQPTIKRPFIDFQNLNCRPHYPKEALSEAQQGTVYLDLNVKEDGSISSVIIFKSSGYPLLDDAVRTAILRNECKALPGTINGTPSAMPAKLQYVWKVD